MKRFLLRHKLIISILFLLLLLVAVGPAFVFSKLSKLDYQDGTVVESVQDEVVGAEELFTEVDAPGEGEQTEGESLSSSEVLGTFVEEEPEEENLISDEEAANLGEAEVILSEGEVLSDKDVFNILLLGTDERASKFSTIARADSIMILSLNKRDKTMKLVSLQAAWEYRYWRGSTRGNMIGLLICSAMVERI